MYGSLYLQRGIFHPLLSPCSLQKYIPQDRMTWGVGKPHKDSAEEAAMATVECRWSERTLTSLTGQVSENAES